jgi:hypothetical protein
LLAVVSDDTATGQSAAEGYAALGEVIADLLAPCGSD